VLDDPERGEGCEAGAAADVDDLEVAAVQVGGLERSSRMSSVQWPGLMT
jgi:hypothetical protein